MGGADQSPYKIITCVNKEINADFIMMRTGAEGILHTVENS